MKDRRLTEIDEAKLWQTADRQQSELGKRINSR